MALWIEVGSTSGQREREERGAIGVPGYERVNNDEKLGN